MSCGSSQERRALSAGFALATWGSRALFHVMVPAATQLPVDLTMDLRVVGFTVAVSVLTCVLFGVTPALHATAASPLFMTHQLGGGRQRRLLDRALVVSQVALSLILLVAAGLTLRTLRNAWTVEPGYERKNVLMFSVDAELAGRRGSEVSESYRRLLKDLAGVPGVRSVGASAVRPVGGGRYLVTSVNRLGDQQLAKDQHIWVAFDNVAPGYFSTLGIPLIAGRDFDERDSMNATRVAIVSERMARHLDGNPLAQLIGTGSGPYEIVGVARNIRYGNVKDAAREVLYFPMFQGQSVRYSPTFEIRYYGALPAVLRSIREVVSRNDPRLAIFRVNTLEAQTWESLSRERLLATLSSYFGGFAVLLACMGLYGLLSYHVPQRTPEVGVRMAMGAQPAAVQWLFVRTAAGTMLEGVTAGLVGSFAVGRLLRAQLFGVEPHDPTTIAGATILMLTAGLAAAYLPARHASRIDPVAALRHE
jgi:predicted permease